MKGLILHWMASLTLHAGVLGVIAVFSHYGRNERESAEFGVQIVRESGESGWRMRLPSSEIELTFEKLEPRPGMEHPIRPEQDFDPVRDPVREEEEIPPAPSRPEPPAPLLERPVRPHELRLSPETGAVETAPSEVSNPPPEYPVLARRRGFEGSLVLMFEIRDDGTCGEIRVLESSGHEILDEAAVGAVRKWRFQPAMRNGRPVPTWQKLRVTFKLKSGP